MLCERARLWKDAVMVHTVIGYMAATPVAQRTYVTKHAGYRGFQLIAQRLRVNGLAV